MWKFQRLCLKNYGQMKCTCCDRLIPCEVVQYHGNSNDPTSVDRVPLQHTMCILQQVAWTSWSPTTLTCCPDCVLSALARRLKMNDRETIVHIITAMLYYDRAMKSQGTPTNSAGPWMYRGCCKDCTVSTCL